MWWIKLNPVWEQNTDSGSPPAAAPAAPAAPAAVDLPPAEMTADAFSDFVDLAERGGLTDRFDGNADFPDLPPVETPLAPQAPSVSAPAVAPSPAAPAPVAQPPVGVTPAVPAAPVVPPMPATPAAQVPPAVAPASPAPAAPQPAVAAPASAPAPQAEPATAQPAVAASADPFAALASELGKQSEAFVGAIAEKLYPISQEDHEAFIGGDTTKLSGLCARIHFNAVNSVLSSISKLMPVMVDGLLRVRKSEEDYENEFWSSNPHLDKIKHREPVSQVLRTYNQLNPNVDQAKRFRDVGLLVAQMHNIPLQAQASASAPAVPQAPPVRTPGPVVRQVDPPGFAPASAGGAPAVAQPPPSNGAWGDFVEFAMANDRGAFDQQG